VENPSPFADHFPEGVPHLFLVFHLRGRSKNWKNMTFAFTKSNKHHLIYVVLLKSIDLLPRIPWANSKGEPKGSQIYAHNVYVYTHDVRTYYISI
jgi:hypothetical protein